MERVGFNRLIFVRTFLRKCAKNNNNNNYNSILLHLYAKEFVCVCVH